MVKMHQKTIWRPDSARTRWGSLQSSGIRCCWSDDVQHSAKCQLICETPLSAQQLSDNCWKHTFSLPISTFRALGPGVSHVMRNINLRYLLTKTTFKNRLNQHWKMLHSLSISIRQLLYRTGMTCRLQLATSAPLKSGETPIGWEIPRRFFATFPSSEMVSTRLWILSI